MRYRILALASLPFALNILLPFLFFIRGAYPYPSLFINQIDTYNDFYAICYWTFNKVGTYGAAYKNIYPPFTHLPCLAFSFLFPDLEHGYDSARIIFPNYLPLFLLYSITIASFFVACRSVKSVFKVKGGWFIPWCLIASSPFLMLLDRGNLLLINVISLNIIVALLCCRPTLWRLLIIAILAAVPVATKPYLALNYIIFPSFALIVIAISFGLNLVGIAIWQPHAVHLIVSNIRNFTDASGLFVSVPALIVDGQMFTSFRQYSSTLLQSLDYSSVSQSVFYDPLKWLVFLCLFLYYLYCTVSVLLFLLIAMRYHFPNLHSFRRQMLSTALYRPVAHSQDYSWIGFLLIACSSYSLVIGILPLFTKSIYWYGVCHLLPCILIADLTIISPASTTSPRLVCFYQSVKIITLTNLVYPPMTRLCEAEPFHRRFLLANFASLYDHLNIEYLCPTPGLETILQFSLRMINLPLLCIIVAYILLKHYKTLPNRAPTA